MVTDKLGTLVPEDYKNKIDLLCSRIIEHYEGRKNFRSDKVEVLFKEDGTFSVWNNTKPILFYKNDTNYKELENHHYDAITELHEEVLYYYHEDNLVRMCTRDFESNDFIFNLSITCSTEIICSLYISLMFFNIHNWNLLVDREYLLAFLRSDYE